MRHVDYKSHLYYNETMDWKEAIKRSLGKPYYEKDFVLLYNIDCIAALKILPRNYIDLVLTSPPYNIGKEYEKVLPIEDYIDWSSSWLNEIPLILKENGAFWYNLGYVPFKDSARALPLVYLLWDKVKMYLMREIVWNYGAGVACKKTLSPRNEKWLWYVNNKDDYTFNLDAIRDPDVKYPNSKKNGKLRCNTLGKNPSDVWQIAKVTSGFNRSSEERTNHPAQFPLDLIDRITLGFSNENDILLDPFMGSGTTAISALKNRRNVIGFEIREDYCELQAKRIDSYFLEQSQNLFAEFVS